MGNEEGDLQQYFSSFLCLPSLSSLCHATFMEATCGHVQERIALQGTYSHRAWTVYGPSFPPLMLSTALEVP